jgi:diacylglycerol kinase family enzyme
VTRVAVIGNPAAGGGADDPASAVERALREAGAEVTLPGAGGDFTEAARRAAETCDIVAAMGGDGTVNAVAAALAGTSTPLLVLPSGTLNHFARDLGVPLDPAEAALLVRDGARREVDVAEVNGRVFVNNSSIGAYPLAVSLRERLQDEGAGGKWTAMSRAALRTFRRFPTLHVRIDGDDGGVEIETPFVFVGNNVYADQGLGAPQRERLDGGRLGVLTAEATTRSQALRIAFLAAIGRLGDSGAVWRGEPTELIVETGAASLLVSLDGEVVRLETPLRYRSRPGALIVIAPRLNGEC